MPKFFKSKWFIGGALVLVLGGGYAYRKSTEPKGPFYETQAVVRQTIKQTVEVTGQLKPQERIDLSFKGSGRLKAVYKKIGDPVKKGELIAELDAADLQFAVQRAEAALATASNTLNARLAGETRESIQIAQASLDQAKANLAKAKSDLEITKQQVEDQYRVAQIALDTAQRNFDNQGTSLDQSVQDSYDSGRNTLSNALGALQTGLSDGDTIIGVDNSIPNDSYETVLGVSDRVSLDMARLQYTTAKNAKLQADLSVHALNAFSSADAIRAAASQLQDALKKTQLYLDYVQKTLAATITSSGLSASELASKKSLIDADRSAVGSQLTAVTAALQSMTSAENARLTTKTQLKNALETATKNLDIADHDRVTKVQTAQTNIVLQQASVASAQAALDLKKAPPRAVDVAALRSQVGDAAVALNQAKERLTDAQIMAPVDGTVSDVVPSIGEQVAPNQKVASMVGVDGFTIEALVPESDIAKVHPGAVADVTLDAFGDDVLFKATVVSEDPDQTKVQDAIYYRTIVSLDAGGRDVKPGMTVNVTIITGERDNVLVIPTRAMRDQDGKRMVRVFDGTAAKDVQIDIGLRGDDGVVEVTNGLEEGQKVVTGELSAADYAKQQATQSATK
jgi:HlyD family secretion protein